MGPSRISCLAVLACLAAMAAVSCKLISPHYSADAPAAWPMFKKDIMRTGLSDAPPIQHPAILWSTEVGIQGYLNCPVIAGDRVFVGCSGTTHNVADAKDGVYCLDKRTGKIIWFQPTETDACGVAYDNGMVFSTGDDGYIRAFRASDGKPLWRIKGDGAIFAQPLILNGLVIIGDEKGNIIAAKEKTGETAWSFHLEKTGIRAGLTSDGNHIYCAFLGGENSLPRHRGQGRMGERYGH